MSRELGGQLGKPKVRRKPQRNLVFPLQQRPALAKLGRTHKARVRLFEKVKAVDAVLGEDQRGKRGTGDVAKDAARPCCLYLENHTMLHLEGGLEK